MIKSLTRLPWRAFQGGIVGIVFGTFYLVRGLPMAPRRAHAFVRAIEPWGILIAVIALVMAMIDFEEDRTARAWQLLASDAPGNSGKIWALEHLGRARHCADWIPWFGLLPEGWQDFVSSRDCDPRAPLHGIDLSSGDEGPSTYLREVRLEGASIRGADLARADLLYANLAGAQISQTNLRE